jgi:hypothetical protein
MNEPKATAPAFKKQNKSDKEVTKYRLPTQTPSNERNVTKLIYKKGQFNCYLITPLKKSRKRAHQEIKHFFGILELLQVWLH